MYKKRARQLNAQLLRQLSTQIRRLPPAPGPGRHNGAPRRAGVSPASGGAAQHRLPAHLRRRSGAVPGHTGPAGPGAGGGLALPAPTGTPAQPMFPSEENEALRRTCAPGAFFFLTLLQVLFDDERTRFPTDPLLDIALLPEEALEGSHYRDCYLPLRPGLPPGICL